MERKLPESTLKRARLHTITVENREMLNVTGVKAVDAFNEYEITLITDSGELRVEGNQLNITKLDLDEGAVMVEGEIQALEYQDTLAQKQSTSLFSRVFK